MGRHQKYLIKLILSFSLIFSPILVWAGAAEKWEIVENIYDATDQKVNVTAKKITQQAANSGVYKVKVPVTSSALGATAKSMLWTGVAVTALQALISAVGWVIDEGSQVIKKPKEEPPVDGYQYKSPAAHPDDAWWNKLSDAARHHITLMNLQDTVFQWYFVSSGYKNGLPSVTFYRCYRSDTSQCLGEEYNYLNRRVAQDVKPTEWIIVSDAELGDEIMGRGKEPKSSPTPSPDIITQAYDPNNPVGLGEPAPKATDDALNSANPEPDTDPTGETKPKPNVDTDGDGKPDVYDPNQPDVGQEFTLPPACEWFPAACDFFKVQKQDNIDIKQNQEKQLEQDKTFFEKVTDFFDWFKEDPSNDNELDIEQSNEQEPNTTISFSTSCPAKIPLQFNWNGQSLDFSFDFTIWCQAISTYVYPIVVTLGSLHALYIVTGVRQDG